MQEGPPPPTASLDRERFHASAPSATPPHEGIHTARENGRNSFRDLLGNQTFTPEIASNPRLFARFLQKHLASLSGTAALTQMQRYEWNILQTKIAYITRNNPVEQQRHEHIRGACAEYFLLKSFEKLEREDQTNSFHILRDANSAHGELPVNRDNYRFRRNDESGNLELIYGATYREIPHAEADLMAIADHPGHPKTLYVMDASMSDNITTNKQWRDYVVGKAMREPRENERTLEIVALNAVYCRQETLARAARNNDWRTIYIPVYRPLHKLARIVADLSGRKSSFDDYQERLLQQGVE